MKKRFLLVLSNNFCIKSNKIFKRFFCFVVFKSCYLAHTAVFVHPFAKAAVRHCAILVFCHRLPLYRRLQICSKQGCRVFFVITSYSIHYTKLYDRCPYCVRAKTLLATSGIAFGEVLIDSDEAAMQEFAAVTNGARTVPQIIIDGVPIGGLSELMKLQQEGRLSYNFV